MGSAPKAIVLLVREDPRKPTACLFSLTIFMTQQTPLWDVITTMRFLTKPHNSYIWLLKRKLATQNQV